MDSVDPKDFTARMSRVATVNADDFQSHLYGQPWDAELYWGMFLWELGILDREPKRVFYQEGDIGLIGERADFENHHFALGDQDWQKMQTIRSVQVQPVEPMSARGTAVLDKGVFKLDSFQRIVDDLLEVPGTKRVQVALANVAESIVEALLEADIDPKAFALRTGQRLDTTPVEITQYAYNQIGELPREDLSEFYRKADRIIAEMIVNLEKATGRRHLDGLHGYMRGFMPEHGKQITRQNAREAVYAFNGGSKKVKV